MIRLCSLKSTQKKLEFDVLNQVCNVYWNLLLFELSAALLYVQDYLVGKKEAAELPSASEW